MLLGVGVVLILAGLVAWLYDAHLDRQRAWDRPAWSLRPLARGTFSATRRVLVVVGWISILQASRWAGVVAAVALTVAWSRIRWVRSARSTTRRLRAELDELRRRDPSCEEHELLGRLVLSRHPEWGPELVSQIVQDHPTPEGLARILTRMERGWSSLE